MNPEAVLESGLAGRYRVERAVGSGGMATVYLAHDLRHHRKVAIKVLRPELAAMVGAERFLKEIEVTANLQHPHILGLIDSGSVDGQLYYVMPFMEGESLRSRLLRERQLSIDETVAIAGAVASALQYAHRRGVVHRDIKPENILLHEGQAVVADFGIALALTQAVGARLTETGLSLGTPQYMSPEQATGEGQVDGRSDIYSLGCAVYEMLAGAPPFTGPTAQAILSQVITGAAMPVSALRPSVPGHLAAAIHTALEKVPADRFATAEEFAEALRRPTARTADRMRALGIGEAKPRPWPLVAAGILALALGLAAGRVLFGGAGVPPEPVRRWSLLLPPDAPLALTGPGPLGIWQLAVAIAPTGDRLAYASARNGTTMLAIRPLDRDSTVVLPGTEGAYHPFFSPDGSWIAYFAGRELRKVPTAGGSPITITTVDRPAGAVWPTGDRILLFQQDGFQMRWVGASGGSDTTALLGAQFGAPEVLPGGRWVVGTFASGQLGLFSLADRRQLAITRRGVVPVDSVQLADLLFGASPKYVPTGHLVFGSGDGDLMALPFDPASLEVRGGPVSVVSGVRIEEGYGFVQYALSPDGTLLFVPGRNQLHGHVARLGPAGRFDTLPLPRGQYTQLRMSPDGTRLALQARKPIGGWDILVVDLETGVSQRIPVEGNHRAYPGAWHPDGDVLMVGLWEPARNVFRGARLYSLDRRAWEDLPPFNGSYLAIAPDGQQFVYSDFRTGDLFLRPLRGDTTSTPVPGRGLGSSFSPDGKWLAWGDAEGGISVSPIPATGAVYPVVERGQQPLWTADGARLIYRDGRRFYEVTVDRSRGVRPGRPVLMTEGPFIRTFAWNHTIGRDGRVIALVAMPGDDTRELGIITGFHRVLERRAPAGSER